jgi:hypothetical protein
MRLELKEGPRMTNRLGLLNTMETWQAMRHTPASDPNGKARGHAHAAYESALHTAGVYKEALRGQNALREEVRTHLEEPEHTFYYWALQYSAFKPEALKTLHKAKSYSERTAILDGIQTALHKAELKKEETRKAHCQLRTAALVEESRKDAEQARAEREHVEQHKAKALEQAVPKLASLAKPAKRLKRLPAPKESAAG